MTARRREVAVQYVRIEIDSVGPADRPCQGVDRYLSEVPGVLEGLKDSTAEDLSEVELSDQVVRKGQPQPVRAQVLHLDDAGWTTHGFRLPKRLDENDRFGTLRPLPVRHQLISMLLHPLVKKPACRPWKVPPKERPVINPDEGLVAGVDGVHVRRLMVLPIHVDDDPVELAEPGRARNLRTACDTGAARQAK